MVPFIPFHNKRFNGAGRMARAINGWPYATSFDTHELDMSKRINVYVIRYDTPKVTLAKRELPGQVIAR